MHRIAATPGGWNPQTEGVIFIQQTPAPIIFLSAADTDIQTVAAAFSQLPPNFPPLRVVNLLQLQQQLTIDTYAEEILAKAEVIIVRLLGGRAYWAYGLEVLQEIIEKTNASLIIMPGDDKPDPDLIHYSNVSLTIVNQLWRYFTEGGVENFVNALKFIADCCLHTHYEPVSPQSVPRVGFYQWNNTHPQRNLLPQTLSGLKKVNNGFYQSSLTGVLNSVGILFYRAHYLSGNLAPIDAICQALVERNLSPRPVFVSSLREPDIQDQLLQLFHPSPGDKIQVLINTTSFAIASFRSEDIEENYLKSLDIPILQVICSGGTLEQWQSDFQGLSPRDVAMNVALPEVDGKIITRAVSFKAVQTWNDSLETDVIGYQPLPDRVSFVADLAANFIRLRQTPIQERRIALILANYPTRNGRLANGVGLDTPESCVEILKALKQAGYHLDRVPANGDELIKWLTAGVTNDPEGQQLRPIYQSLSHEDYQEYFNTLPEKVQESIRKRWGDYTDEKNKYTTDIFLKENVPISHYLFPIPGIQLGNIFIGIQPSRGYDIDPSLNYHAPDLEPTHEYLAFYYWLKSNFKTHAIAHIGKHGNLEWLPGKSLALSHQCYPEIALGALPHFYPFIVNDPGEGSQAKRRAHAVIIDHLTPPMTRAELYGSLQQLETLIDEYYEAQSLDPSRLNTIRDRLLTLIRQENLNKDLGIEQPPSELTEFITKADGYLCELKEAQIRDGLHIFGQCPQGRQLRDLIIAIARHPSHHRIGLTRALAQDLNLDFDPLTANPTHILNNKKIGDIIEHLEEKAAYLVDNLIETQNPISVHLPSSGVSNSHIGKATQQELQWIKDYLLPSLLETNQEITNLLHGLNGGYIPSGASGAPTRGRADVLPTGRNFYSVDIRAIPTETAYHVGQLAAERLIERYTQENGEYPQNLGLSVWGTSTMRTGGDDIAEALALLGVKPIWDGPSRRVIDFEILPLSVLGRPRIDVTLRISGFFRDAFPNLIDLFDAVVNAIASLNEPPELNPLACQVQKETQFWQLQGLTEIQAKARSRYRIFGSKPGAYGAGLQGLIEGQNWTNVEDLAQAYINWSSYAYSNKSRNSGLSEPEAFTHRLSQLQIVLHNQDNREHDLLDSDDYYQFQGGMTAAIRALTGKNPHTYFGDNSLPENPKVRQLKEEIARVYRSRVINPKWIAGVMRHGYKGAFEMGATVDYLFAYDATANCVEDFMYQGIAENYVFDPKTQDFMQSKNPWVLRDISERLLEAHQRNLWQNVDVEILDKLRVIALHAEGIIETTTT
jgi:cobaltochelatase CobN